jgi:hypothetical protein
MAPLLAELNTKVRKRCWITLIPTLRYFDSPRL